MWQRAFVPLPYAQLRFLLSPKALTGAPPLEIPRDAPPFLPMFCRLSSWLRNKRILMGWMIELNLFVFSYRFFICRRWSQEKRTRRCGPEGRWRPSSLCLRLWPAIHCQRLSCSPLEIRMREGALFSLPVPGLHVRLPPEAWLSHASRERPQGTHSTALYLWPFLKKKNSFYFFYVIILEIEIKTSWWWNYGGLSLV